MSLFQSDYPPSAFYFTVGFSGTLGLMDSAFKEVSGIESKMEVETVQEGGENNYAHQLPKGVTHPNLVLKRGIAPLSSPLVGWCKAVLEGGLDNPIVPQSLVVSLLNEQQSPIRTWSFDQVYPVSWSVEEFNATKNEVAIEKIELSYTQLTRLK